MYQFDRSLYGFCICLLLLFAAPPVFTQDFPYTFQTWDAKNGLSSNYCNAIAQDADGYLYIGSNNGLYVFNGSNFKKAYHNTAYKLVTEGNVEDILIDAYSRIWFASIEFGVGLIDLKERNVRVQYFVPPPSDSFPNLQILNNPRVSKLCFDSRGNLWVGTRGNGLFTLDTATKKFNFVKTDNQTSFYNKFIRSLFLYKPDSLFVGSVNGLSILNPLKKEITPLRMHYSADGKLVRPTVRKVLPWSADSFMLATDRGTFWLSMHDKMLGNIYSDTTKKINFRKINSNDIYRFSKNEIWIATEDDGILFYNVRTHKFKYSFRQSEFNSGISRGFVNKFFKSADDNIWITHQNGLSLFQIQNTLFNNFSYPNSRLFTGTLITDGDRLLCFKSNSITVINTATGEIEVKKIILPVRGTVNHCHATDYSPDEYMLFVNDAFFLLNKKTLRPKILPLNKEKIDPVAFKHFRVMRSIMDTVNSRQRMVLLAKTINGNILLNYFPATGDLVSFIPPGFKQDDFKNDFTNIIKTGNGKYWISTLYNGLIYVAGADSSIQYAPWQVNEERKIPDGEIKDFTITTGNDIWLLNQKKGLVHVSVASKRAPCYEIFSEREGLTDNSLYNIVHDPQKNLWITSNTGLFCFLTKQKDMLKYTAANGFSNMKFYAYDANMASLPNGYIGIYEEIGNVTWFKPQPNAREKKINLLLASVQINEQSINLTSLSSPLALSAGQNDISFQYDIIDFDKTAFYEVLYKLDNFDARWYPAYQNKDIRYAQLPPGEYTFKIKLKYASNQFSPEKSVQFSIATIWYSTWWFKSLAALLSLGIVYLVIRIYINRKLFLQKKELELQNAVALERARISTELHDDLGSGLSTIRILSQSLNGGNNTNGNPNLEKISSHSRELIQKMREIVWALNNENDTLDQLISYIRRQSSTLLENAGIGYQYRIPEMIPEIKVTGGNRRHIQLLVKEAVHNIVKHSGATEVLFSVTATDDLTIAIHDNGTGIPESCTHASLGNGIRNMKKHTEAVQGALAVKNHIGTTIQLSIPLRNLSHESAI